MVVDRQFTDPAVTINSKEYRFRLWTAPLLCLVSCADEDAPVWRLQAVRLRREGGIWQDVIRAEMGETRADGAALQLVAEDGSLLHFDITCRDDQLRLEVGGDIGAGAWLAVETYAGSRERFLGFGERFDSLDQRGKQVDLWVEDGAQMGLTYIPIPFFLSDAGYGLYIDTQARCVVRVATPDDPTVVSIRNAAPRLSLTVLPGGSPKEIVSRYTAIAGRPAVPPPWVFGPWKSRDWQSADQAGIREDVQKQHELGLPATVKLIDARWEEAYHTFAFDPAKFPNPEAMIKHVHAQGSRLVLWVSPWMAVDNGDDPNDAFYACAERGYLIRKPDGEVYIHRLGNNPMLVGSCLDFTHPETIAWWQENIRRLARMGVSGFNTDFGEQVPADAVFHDGRTGHEMHNLYPRLYNELTFEAMQEGQPGVLLARSGWHGSQRLSAIWAGDQTSDFAHNSGLRTAIVAGLSAGLSGFPFWSSDIGGYFGTPSAETYMRWVQFSAFCPIMMIHGAGRREPWTFSAQTLSVYRRYARLHTALFPYIFTYAHEAARTGVPIMRAMPLEFPHEADAWGELAEHQYFFGAELLVAPVYYGFDPTRLVYLPVGQWRDFWTGDVFEGGQVIRYRTDLETIPVFARAGAIIPWIDPSPDTLLPTDRPGVRCAGNDLRVDVYPGADGHFRLHDGTQLRWVEASQALTVAGSPVKRNVSVRRVGTVPNYKHVMTVQEVETTVRWPI